ncbi:MAG: MFS transporter, partial [Bacteroidota bacterium]
YGPEFEIIQGDQSKFYILLGSILLLGAGATILQVAGNPIMRDVSAEGKYSSNLSFAQAIKAIGSSLGFILPPLVATWMGWNFSVLFPIYSGLIVINILWINSVKIKERKAIDSKPASIGSCLSLLGNGYVLMIVLAIFLYVGAEVSMSSGVPMLLKDAFQIEEVGLWIAWALFFLPIFVGRLFGSLILRAIKPRAFLLITVIVSIIGILMMFTKVQMITFAGVILVGLGFANIFPLIFSMAIDKMPERTNELSGLMVTAIVGGAFIPPLMGVVADNSSILIGFFIPLICIIYITFVATFAGKK